MLRFRVRATRLVALVCCLSSAVPALAAPEPLPAPNLRLFAPAAVSDVEVLPDGSTIVTGDFTAVHDAASGLVVPRPRIAKFDANGELDLAWNPVPDAAGTIRGIELSADASALYVWGSFSTLGGVAFDTQGTRLARVAATGGGATDAGWVPPSLRGGSGSSFVTDVVEVGDHVWVGGSFTSLGAGTAIARLARLDRFSAAPDVAFVPAPDAEVLALTPGAGNVHVSGRFTTIAGATQPFLARFASASGGFSTAWRPSVPAAIGPTTTSPDGTLVYGAGVVSGQVVRVDATGTSTQNFLGGSVALSLAVAPDGAIHAGGFFAHLDATADALARYSAAGQLDASFRPNADRAARALAFDADGGLLAGGDFTTLYGTRALGFARLSSGVDRATDVLKPGDVRTIARAPDGSTFIGGNFAYVDDLLRLGVAKLTPALAVDPAWSIPDVRIANALLVAGDHVVVSTLGSAPTPLRRWSVAAPATLDAAWQPVPLPGASQLAAHAGWLYYDNGLPGNAQAGIKRVALAGGGAEDTAWGANATLFGMGSRGVRVVAIDAANDRLYAAGTFTSAGGQPRTNAARFVLSTGAVDAWAPDPDGNVTSLALHGAHAYLGGSFTQFAATATSGLVRVARDPLAGFAADPAFLPALAPALRPNALLATDLALFTGPYRIRYDGSVDASWQGPDRVTSLDERADGVLVGGSFVQVGTQPRVALALLPAIVDGVFGDGFENAAP